MGSDHASDEYLEGLSDLDRAKVVVLVRWCQAQWRSSPRGPERMERELWYPLLPGYDVTFPIATPEIEIAPFQNLDRVHEGASDWGTNWQGTASLMELAATRRWSIMTLTNDWKCDLLHSDAEGFVDATIDGCKADTIHAAVLLACAAAAMRGNSDGK